LKEFFYQEKRNLKQKWFTAIVIFHLLLKTQSKVGNGSRGFPINKLPLFYLNLPPPLDEERK
jgi:hypothetical protein